ncbi:gamma-glutamyl-gamma-aminobutyrate hydrolase family protein [Nonomuraea sp. NBC_01738]|uniref:CTP synthase C-terminal region-related (seleno)protein n=1 Tax=Nonomuraea sp. NBC_01738 TaxID=2976003 RepID=UPI002E0E0657|nr:gamma-glutamyl-gamma-aminobutyrate hydrolase family protein [Nonomuraea sp. NBC_01738]WSG18882.1 gamma-glutamyl-gamma-aminobutyrate hydrolase family protein [Nonomuraea sp. NBC_01738]
MTIPRLALVGDRSAAVRAHTRVPAILDALADQENLPLDAYWLPTDAVGDVSGFDGVWIVPGSPYRSEEGALSAARTARTLGIPLLGTCGGFQHAVLEFARGVCGLSAEHAENTPGASDPLIEPLACSLAGHEGVVRLAPGSLIERIVGADRRLERYHCAFALNHGYQPVLEAHGLRFTAHDEKGAVRAAELPGHPFYLATLFQPELDEGPRPHPVITAFAAAVSARASSAVYGGAVDDR